MTTLAPATAWADLSAQERRKERFARWLSAPGVEFVSPEAEAGYKARVQRLIDAITLEKEPDRVPCLVNGTFLVPSLYGVSAHAAMYDHDVIISTFRRFVDDYEPDYHPSPVLIGDGRVFEILGCKQYRWPGHGVSESSGYQYVEGEYMTVDDYRALIDDPSDFWLRTYLPRVFEALAPLERIPRFTNLWEVVLAFTHVIPFGTPEVQGALKALMDAGSAALEWIQKVGAFDAEMKSRGYAGAVGGLTKAPFDTVADTLRGTRAAMVDVHRRPELMLEAAERIIPLAIKQGVEYADAAGVPVVFLPLHKGADGFMSDQQFRELYWPSLKAVLLGLIEEGCVPCLFCEGGYNSRLEYLRELPRGSAYCLFDRTDMRTAKEVLGDTLCIAGNVPSGLVLTGTAEQMRAYCKELIDTVAPGGGFIMAFGTAMDEGKPETVHAMIDFTKEYGVYRQT